LATIPLGLIRSIGLVIGAILPVASHGAASQQSPGPTPAANSLFVSVPTHHKADEYLTSCEQKAGDKWINCLAKARGNGTIETIYSVAATAIVPRGILPLGDYRVIHGTEWFFRSTTDAAGTTTRESCVLGADRQPRNCFSMKWLDAHDMLVAENGDRIYMFYVPRVRPRVWFSGKALDLVLRRVNAENKVVWEWSSADHDLAEVKDPPRKNGFVSEAASWIKQVRTSILTNLGVGGEEPICVNFGAKPRCMHMHWVDYLHANRLGLDPDGGNVVSGRYVSEVFKIDFPGGMVSWVFGGYHAQRADFKLVDDPMNGFSYQHSARVLANGNILLFDNGNGRPDQHTRAAEYSMDMQNKTATLVWSYPASADFAFRNCCGLVQRLKNGNTLIAWGGLGDKSKTSMIPVATEVTPGQKIVFELRSNVPELPYRVWKNEK